MILLSVFTLLEFHSNARQCPFKPSSSAQFVEQTTIQPKAGKITSNELVIHFGKRAKLEYLRKTPWVTVENQEI